MDSNKSTSAVLFVILNLLFFTLVSGCNTCNNNPIPRPNPNPYPTKGSCPRDALKLGVCAKVLNGAVGANVGQQPDHPCCTILGGLLDLEAALCLCTALKANVLGININIPIALSLLVSTCQVDVPKDFVCP